MGLLIMARPKIEIDWKIFDKLCELHCTLAEIASWFDCSDDTIENRVLAEKGMLFSEYWRIKSAKGKISLRRIQLKLAERNAAMAIFLGKNLLGQRDDYGVDVGVRSWADFMRKAQHGGNGKSNVTENELERIGHNRN